jgi:hypothetical protein
MDIMDIKGLKTLNYIGTFLFRLLGSLPPLFILISAILYDRDSFAFPSIVMITVIWILAIIIIGEFLYRNTVWGLEDGNYDAAKTWIFIGIFAGIMGGIIPFIIFVISYVSFDEAVRRHENDPGKFNNLRKVNPITHCPGCTRQIPNDSKLCPYCGLVQSTVSPPKTPAYGQ